MELSVEYKAQNSIISNHLKFQGQGGQDHSSLFGSLQMSVLFPSL